MKKILSVFMVVCIPLFLMGQYTYFSTSQKMEVESYDNPPQRTQNNNSEVSCTSCTIVGINPAPCSIEGYGTPRDIYLIRVGVYERRIVPKRGITQFKIGNYYHFFLEKEFFSKEEAKQVLSRVKEFYCDAIVVKHPFEKVFYQ